MSEVEKKDVKTTYTPSKSLVSCFEWVSAAMTALMLVCVLFAVFFRMVNVDGDSMNNTLHNGDRLLISNFMYEPEYGDIVVIRRVDDTPLIKRVIGLPGDTIYINPQTGIVYRNGEALQEDYVYGGFTPTNGLGRAVEVEKGTLFVMGDNRCASLDSRMLGCLSQEYLVGRVIYRIGPNSGKVE